MTGINDPLNDSHSSSASGQGPGRLVKQAREQLALSLEDLAAQIKLSRFTLDAIERDDFAQLNEAVYVRGYYRKLSKVLPVTESDLMQAYERVAGHKAPTPPSKLILAGGPELGSGRALSFKVVAIGVIVLGVLIGALAFWGKNRLAEPAAAPNVVPAPSVTPESAPVLEAPPAAEPTTATPPSDASSAPAVVPAPTAVAPAVPAPAAAEPAAAVATANGPLQIQFSASSWAEIKDASGRVLVSGLVEGGSSQGLDGRPPFTVFLGNAPAVRISYNGQPVDTTPFRRGDNTARLTIPTPSP